MRSNCQRNLSPTEILLPIYYGVGCNDGDNATQSTGDEGDGDDTDDGEDVGDVVETESMLCYNIAEYWDGVSVRVAKRKKVKRTNTK